MLAPTTYLEEHAFLSPSNHHWLNYTPEKLKQVWGARTAKELGTRLHIFAQESIELGIKLHPAHHPTVSLYVNDCIDYGMHPEVHLEYDINCFGTADALLFKHNVLHIWDLKTGSNRVHHTQLFIYAAIFCLQHRIDPYSITYDLRMYQNARVAQALTYPETIAKTMAKIVEFSELIESEKKNIRY